MEELRAKYGEKVMDRFIPEVAACIDNLSISLTEGMQLGMLNHRRQKIVYEEWKKSNMRLSIKVLVAEQLIQQDLNFGD